MSVSWLRRAPRRACSLLVVGFVSFASLVSVAAVGARAAAPEAAPAARPYVLRISPKPGPRPLILAFHGLYLGSAWMEHATGLDAALARGFDVVYLDGVDASWNAGTCCGTAARTGVDDVGYVRAVIADVATRTPITDAYAAGFSNGGMFAWRLACDRVVRAAVVVAGALVANCPHPVAVLHIHGVRDRTVPYRGGYSTFTHTTFPDEAHPHLPHGSALTTVLWSGAHSWPAWATARALTWLTDLPPVGRPSPARTLIHVPPVRGS